MLECSVVVVESFRGAAGAGAWFRAALAALRTTPQETTNAPGHGFGWQISVSVLSRLQGKAQESLCLSLVYCGCAS